MKKSELKMFPNGDKHWYLDGLYHRIDGPAVEYTNGEKRWYLNGYLHREDGPAIISKSGYKEYYLSGKLVTEREVMMDINLEITEREYIKFVMSL